MMLSLPCKCFVNFVYFMKLNLLCMLFYQFELVVVVQFSICFERSQSFAPLIDFGLQVRDI